MRKKVNEMIRIIEDDGWYFVRQTGNHKHYRPPTNPAQLPFRIMVNRLCWIMR